jgi:hypothetical protein
MKTLQSLERYFATAAHYTGSLKPLHLRQGIHPFVTISREAGAGGHSLAETLLAQMRAIDGIPVFRDWQVMVRRSATRSWRTLISRSRCTHS